MSPTADRVRELFDYDHLTGIFIRKTTSPNAPKGTVAGTKKDNGYLHVCIDRKKHGLHRIAWLHFYGAMPEADIDHIDGNRTNNAISNLRAVDRSTNLENIKSAKSHNKSTGILGAYFNKKLGKFYSRIKIKGKDMCLGHFGTALEAHNAYISAKRKHHAGNTI